MFVVFDTSVVVAAFINPSGLSSELIRLSGKTLLICTSCAIIEEISKVLTAKNVSATLIKTFVDRYETNTLVCDQGSYTDLQISDDDHIIGCFEVCIADMITSFDKALLRKLKELYIPGVHPADLPHYYPSQ